MLETDVTHFTVCSDVEVLDGDIKSLYCLTKLKVFQSNYHLVTFFGYVLRKTVLNSIFIFNLETKYQNLSKFIALISGNYTFYTLFCFVV